MPVAALSEITDWITDVVGDHGLYAVFLLMMIDAVFPAASELVMVYAGAVAAGAFAGQSVSLFGHDLESGFPAYLAIATAGTIGYLVGAIAGWGAGDYLGRPWLERHGRWLHLSPAKLDRAERWFDRWEGWAVFLGRITPVMRSFISVPAGVFRARFGPYVWLTLLGSAIWCFGFAGLGWAAGANWERVNDAFHYVEYLVVAAIVVGVVSLVAWRLVRRRKGPANEPI
ncbi:DedA family protein [Gaiella sp.]|jgi:membrane protein DedA with SNARE-associated domain|uniref:DedA family protein n=1 Tax=Gaiella sp. TaxID=2663207 RepID=UPI002E334039|nr:DedA family protein [Gaiella sp.]HEX5585450.1 DedA family protein [Gaiella sp.]